MSNALIAFFLAAGGATFMYSKMGKRVGYGNQQNVLVLVVITFVLIFIMMMIFLNTLITLN